VSEKAGYKRAACRLHDPSWRSAAAAAFYWAGFDEQLFHPIINRHIGRHQVTTGFSDW